MLNSFKSLLKQHPVLFHLGKTIQLTIREFQKIVWRLKRNSAIKDYLQSYSVHKLQIGVGTEYCCLAGWFNTDYYPQFKGVNFLDATKPFPFENNTFDYIFSEHMIEHITYCEGLEMLRECYRVLKPQGKIRIATPNLQTLMALYQEPKHELQTQYIHWIIDYFVSEPKQYRESFVINNQFRNYGHQFIYDEGTLQTAMVQVGFTKITIHSVGQSDDENFQQIESHGKSFIGTETLNQFETMVLEGVKGG